MFLQFLNYGRNHESFLCHFLEVLAEDFPKVFSYVFQMHHCMQVKIFGNSFENILEKTKLSLKNQYNIKYLHQFQKMRPEEDHKQFDSYVARNTNNYLMFIAITKQRSINSVKKV